jgi:GH35 family endo-1,4-beta-xylanase
MKNPTRFLCASIGGQPLSEAALALVRPLMAAGGLCAAALAVHAEQPPATLRAAYADAVPGGAALDTAKVTGGNPRATEIVARQFSSLTAENDMKWSASTPSPTATISVPR